MAGIHHVEIRVADFVEARDQWGWLLKRLGYDRRAPGVNHIAFKAADEMTVDQIMTEAKHHGWRPLYQESYPHAGGPGHYAGWLENSAGFKAEVVAGG